MVNFNLFSRIITKPSSTHQVNQVDQLNQVNQVDQLNQLNQDVKVSQDDKVNDEKLLYDNLSNLEHSSSSRSNRLLSKLRSTSSQRSKIKPFSSSNSLTLLQSPQASSSYSSLLLQSPSTSQSSNTFSSFRKRSSSLKPNHHHILTSTSDSTIKSTKDHQLSYRLPPIDLQEELALDHQSTTNTINSNLLTTPQINPPTSPTRSCLTSSPLSFQSSNQPHSNIMTPQSRSQSPPQPTSRAQSPSQSKLKSRPQSPSQSKFKSTPSIRSNNTIFSFRSKLRVGRRKNQDEPSLHRQNSQASLATPIHPSTPPITSTSPKLNSAASLYTDPTPIKSTDLNPSQTSSGSSFQLKSFRNVRSTSSPGGVSLLQSIPSTPTRQKTTPAQKTTITESSTLTQSIRPSPLPLIPSSPNPTHCQPSSSSSAKRISAAAFREARQARTTSRSSLTSTYSDKSFLQFDPHQNNHQNRLSYWAPSNSSINLYQGFSSTSMMNSGRAMSDIGLPTQPKQPQHHHQSSSSSSSSTPRPNPSDHFKRNVSQPSNHSGRLSYYHNSKSYENENDVDILIPPRPAFYGSSSSNRPRSTHDRSSNSSPSTSQFYKLQTSSSSQRSLVGASHSSQRSLPINPRPISSMTKSSSKVKDSTLDKWHSDSDSDSEERSNSIKKTNNSSKAIGDDEDDEDDEIPLSKLKKNSYNSLKEMKPSSIKTKSISSIPPISITTTTPTPNNLPFLLNVNLPSSTSNNSLIQQQQQQYRGISPASSSSGGSGGPITPLDSTLAINLIRKDEELMLEKAPNGVDQCLYNGLSHSDKLQLHQRSQMMMQMIAAQAQMHAMALSNHQVHQQQQQQMEMNFNRFENSNSNMMGYRGSQSVIGITSEMIKKNRNPTSPASGATIIGRNHSSGTITKFKP